MSECKCDMRTRLVGDGCEVCNPAKALEFANERIAELESAVKAAFRWLNTAVADDVRAESPQTGGFSGEYLNDLADMRKVRDLMER